MHKIKGILKFIFDKLFMINDSPQKVALGVGIGVFCGIFPGTGPAAALFLAFVFRVNRAAALAGSLFSNTWLSLVTFILAIRVGSAILRVDWQQLKESSESIIRGFHFFAFFKLSFIKVFLPLILGYIVIGLVCGFFSYLITFLVIRRVKNGNNQTG